MSENLPAEIRSAEERVAQLQSAVLEYNTKLEREEERLRLLLRLSQLDADEESALTRESPSSGGTPLAVQEPRPIYRTVRKTARPRLEDSVVQLLKESSEPLHISVIMKSLKDRGVKIPGKGTEANVITRILRDLRIERVPGRRGIYTLKESVTG